MASHRTVLIVVKVMKTRPYRPRMREPKLSHGFDWVVFGSSILPRLHQESSPFRI
jgi:hypothetical protein